SFGSKRYHHPLVGDLTVDYECLPLPGDPDQTLCLYTTEAGSPSENALRLLANWTAQPTLAEGVPQRG
ncbi:MAG TPA: transcriptional regulator, partial [Umezawaea sp.]|nr:transcriptional regulator [Umezawaea sp.]